MAKTFAQINNVAKSTTYGQLRFALVVAAAMNSTIDFTPILKPGAVAGDLTASAEYNIQRVKRTKAKDIANPTSGSTTDALAALDTFTTTDWTSISTGTGTLRGIGLKLGINTKYDSDNIGAAEAKTLADQVQVQAIERNELLLKEIFDNATQTSTFTAPAVGTTPIFDEVTKQTRAIQLKSDDFKEYSSDSNMIILMHPTIADHVVKEIGQEFNNEMPIYKTGLTSKFSINGIPVVIDSTLNKFYKTGESDKRGAIVMDIESVAFKAANELTGVNVNLGLTKYVGTYYYSLQKLVDKERVTVINFDVADYTAAPPRTPLVSE